MNLLIAGLGNPGSKYEKTRHNIGFVVLDHILKDKNVTWSNNKNSLYAKSLELGVTIHWVKPQEFMNLSGKEVSRFAKLYKIPFSQILIVHDEIDIPFGKIKNKIGGGTAGHNGLGDIVERTGDSSFHRLRFGVGKPSIPEMDIADFVLQKFTQQELDSLDSLIQESQKRILTWIQERSKAISS